MANPIDLGLFAPVYGEAWNDFLTISATEQWFAGGRGSGKSSFISLALVAGVVANGGCCAAIFRKWQTDLKDSVFNQCLWAVSRLGLDAEFRVGLSPLRLTVRRTGGAILFFGLDDPGKRKSIKPPTGYFRFLWFEELDQFAGMAEVRSVRQSVFRGGEVFQSFYSFNPPESSANWVNAEAARPSPGRKVYRSDYRDIPPEWLGPQFLAEADALRLADERLYRHEYLGEATGTGGEIFANLEARPISDAEIAGFRCVRHGLDFGFENDPTALLSVAYDASSRTVYVFGEWVRHHQFASDIHGAISARGLTRAVIVADSAEPRAIAEINRLGANLKRCRKAPGWPEDGVRWLRSRRRIVIDAARCPVAWREFSTYEFDRFRDGSLRSEYPDRDNHAIDAVRYALEAEIARDAGGGRAFVPVTQARTWSSYG